VKKLIHKYKSQLSTFFGAIVAIATAWQAIDWDNFELNAGTIGKLLTSALIALGGYITSINVKHDETN
jgi:hypothetical protein